MNQKENNKQRTSFYKTMLNKELTWTAIAAIGGLIIIIWNIIKYLFTLCSSFRLHRITRVPLYLLMMRKNLNVTDAHLVFSTFIIFAIIFAHSNFNPIKKGLSKKTILYSGLLSLLIMAILTILVSVIKHESIKSSLNLLLTFYSQDLIPVAYTILLFYVYPDYKYYNNESKRLRDKFATSSDIEETDIYEKEINKLDDKYGFFLYAHYIFLLMGICSLFLPVSHNVDILLDQNNQLIVADLGTQYIVQSTAFDNDGSHLTVDISNYSIIDSTNEVVTVTTLLDSNIEYIQKKVS